MQNHKHVFKLFSALLFLLGLCDLAYLGYSIYDALQSWVTTDMLLTGKAAKLYWLYSFLLLSAAFKLLTGVSGFRYAGAPKKAKQHMILSSAFCLLGVVYYAGNALFWHPYSVFTAYDLVLSGGMLLSALYAAAIALHTGQLKSHRALRLLSALLCLCAVCDLIYLVYFVRQILSISYVAEALSAGEIPSFRSGITFAGLCCYCGALAAISILKLLSGVPAPGRSAERRCIGALAAAMLTSVCAVYSFYFFGRNYSSLPMRSLLYTGLGLCLLYLFTVSLHSKNPARLWQLAIGILLMLAGVLYFGYPEYSRTLLNSIYSMANTPESEAAWRLTLSKFLLHSAAEIAVGTAVALSSFFPKRASLCAVPCAILAAFNAAVLVWVQFSGEYQCFLLGGSCVLCLAGVAVSFRLKKQVQHSEEDTP